MKNWQTLLLAVENFLSQFVDEKHLFPFAVDVVDVESRRCHLCLTRESIKMISISAKIAYVNNLCLHVSHYQSHFRFIYFLVEERWTQQLVVDWDWDRWLIFLMNK